MEPDFEKMRARVGTPANDSAPRQEGEVFPGELNDRFQHLVKKYRAAYERVPPSIEEAMKLLAETEGLRTSDESGDTGKLEATMEVWEDAIVVKDAERYLDKSDRTFAAAVLAAECGDTRSVTKYFRLFEDMCMNPEAERGYPDHELITRWCRMLCLSYHAGGGKDIRERAVAMAEQRRWNEVLAMSLIVQGDQKRAEEYLTKYWQDIRPGSETYRVDSYVTPAALMLAYAFPRHALASAVIARWQGQLHYTDYANFIRDPLYLPNLLPKEWRPEGIDERNTESRGRIRRLMHMAEGAEVGILDSGETSDLEEIDREIFKRAFSLAESLPSATDQVTVQR